LLSFKGSDQECLPPIYVSATERPPKHTSSVIDKRLTDMVDTTASSMLCGHTRTHQKFLLLLTRSRFVRRLILGLSRKGLSFRITIPSVNMHDVTKHYRSVICLSMIPRNCPKRRRAPQLSRLGKSSSPQLVNEGFSIVAETNGLGRSALG
jgi:hypothetical protein